MKANLMNSPPNPMAVNLRIVFLEECATKVSPPFEGGVAGRIDYLIFTKFFSRPGWLIKLILTETSYGYIIKYKGLRTRIISLAYKA